MIEIAIAGTSASGKGTLAKKLSVKYQIPHLDTGLMYRKIASEILNNKIDNNNLLEGNVNAFIEMSEAQQFVSALGADCNSAIAIQVDDATDWGNCRGLMLQAEIYGKDSFIRVASHDENGDILKKEYATMKEFPHAGEHEVITNILIEEAIEKGALDLLNEHN